MRRGLICILFLFLLAIVVPSLTPAIPGMGTTSWADEKDDQLKKKLKDHRDRLLGSLKDVPGGQWYGKASACEVWKAMDKSQRYVFLTHTDLLGQRSLLYNYPYYFYPYQSCDDGECTESSCAWVDDMGYCRYSSGWDCYYANRCGIDRGAPTDYTMAIEHVNRMLWVAGSCPWPTTWQDGGNCVNDSGGYTGRQNCGGEDNNRIYYEADDSLMGMFRNRDYGLPMWDKSQDLAGPHKGFTNTSETLHGRRSNFMATGQTHFFAWDSDPNKWVEGRTLWSRFCNERSVGAACNGSAYAPSWAARMIEQDLDYTSPWHESSPVCHYSMGQGFQQYNTVWTNQVTGNDAAYDYDPCAGPQPQIGAVVDGVTYSSTIYPTTTITIFGSGFSADGNMIHLQRSGYADVWLFNGDGHYFWDYNGTQINASLDGRAAAGTWTLTVRNASGAVSGPYTLTIQDNAAASNNAYYCYSSTYSYYGFQNWLCNAAYNPTYCYTQTWQWTPCPSANTVSQAVCGNGICEVGESGSTCGQDCCDQYTNRWTTKQNQGVYYCRNMYYYDTQTGYASWHGWQWVTQNETTQMCNDWWEAWEGSYYQTQYQCGGSTGKCHSITGGYY